MMRKIAKPLLLIVGFIVSTDLMAEDLFYRYKNMAGETVIESTAPSANVATEYEVLNDEGKIIEAIQQAAPSADFDTQKNLALEKLQRQSAQDKALLSQFKSIRDIELLKSATATELQEEIAHLIAAQNEEEDPEALTSLSLQLQLRQLSLSELQTNFEKKVKRYTWLTKKD